MGDSLSASYGINQKDGWVNLLEQRLVAQGFHYTVINASISGETTSSALSRFDDLLKQYNPDIVIVELGANDGLRGLPLENVYTNLALIIEQSQSHEAEVLLTGMRIPPNYGRKYTDQFADVYVRLARHYKVDLLPFLLDGIGNNKTMFQSDGLHPIAAAQPIILDNVWTYLVRMLTKGIG